jgi:hypothetical protein
MAFQKGFSRAARPLGAQGHGAERRRDKRYQVDLPGRLQRAGADCTVLVSDLSATGALVAAEGIEAFCASGDGITLVLEEFGPIEAQVVHAGTGFCGLRFLDPHLHRDRLSAWLRAEIGGP